MIKKLLVKLLLFGMVSTAYGNAAELRMQISTAQSDNRYFLCVSNNMCFSIHAGDQGERFPINTGKLAYLYPTNVSNLMITPEKLPASCQITLHDNQTLVVAGKITTLSNGAPFISQLNCRIE